MEGDSMAIYERIRNLREDHDWTQKQVAEMLHTSRTSYCAYENGVTPEVYAAVIAEMPNYDEDGNGSLNQEEVKNALNKMGRGAFTLPGGTNDFTLSREDKAVIWQLYNKSWKYTSNPFGTGAGKRIYDALNPERE